MATPRGPGAAPGTAGDAASAASGGLGPPVPHRGQLPAGLCRPVAPEAGAGSGPAPIPDHRARHGLPLPVVSEPPGRGAAWTEERGTSDEGRRRPKAAPETSGQQRTSDEGRRRLKSAPETSGQQRTSDEGRRRLKSALETSGQQRTSDEGRRRSEG